MRRLFGPRGLIQSFAYAIAGVRYIWRNEPNFRIHFVMGALAIVAGFVLRISLLEWVAVSIAIMAVMAAESFNTAIELLADAVHPDHHDKIGKCKDISAGAVLLIAIAAFAAGAIIFFPKAWQYLQTIWSPPSG